MTHTQETEKQLLTGESSHAFRNRLETEHLMRDAGNRDELTVRLEALCAEIFTFNMAGRLAPKLSDKSAETGRLFARILIGKLVANGIRLKLLSPIERALNNAEVLLAAYADSSSNTQKQILEQKEAHEKAIAALQDSHKKALDEANDIISDLKQAITKPKRSK